MGSKAMKNAVEMVYSQCKKCNGKGFVFVGHYIKGLTGCPVCRGKGFTKRLKEEEL